MPFNMQVTLLHQRPLSRCPVCIQEEEKKYGTSGEKDEEATGKKKVNE